MLEDGVQSAPHRVDYWAELFDFIVLRDRDTSLHQLPLECVSRAALAANANSPELLFARAVYEPPSAALEDLCRLEHIPGHERLARDAQDFVRTGLPIPVSWQDCDYVDWAERLIGIKQWSRAGEIVHRGLERDPHNRRLLGLLAMTLAYDGKYDQALELQKLSGYRHEPIEEPVGARCPIRTLADLFLMDGKPELVIKSFGDAKPPDAGAGEEWLVFAQAKLLQGDNLAAESVLCKADDRVAANLLRVANLLRKKRNSDAHQLGAELHR